MITDKKPHGNLLLMCLAIVFLMSACAAPRHYAGEPRPDDQVASITLQTNRLEIRKIDGEKTKLPNPTKSFLIGGGYVGMAKALGTVKTKILPGQHTVLIAYRLNNCIASGSGIATFTAEANHAYRVSCTVSKATGNYTTRSIVGNEEIVTRFTDAFEHDITFFVEDVTNEASPVRVGQVTSTIVLRQ